MSYSNPLSNALGANGPLESDVMPVLNHAAQQADGLLQRGADALRENRTFLQEGAERTQAQVNTYVREEPLKSLLMAAAAGAVLMGLVGLIVGHLTASLRAQARAAAASENLVRNLYEISRALGHALHL